MNLLVPTIWWRHYMFTEFLKDFGWDSKGLADVILGEARAMILFLQNVIINIT